MLTKPNLQRAALRWWIFGVPVGALGVLYGGAWFGLGLFVGLALLVPLALTERWAIARQLRSREIVVVSLLALLVVSVLAMATVVQVDYLQRRSRGEPLDAALVDALGLARDLDTWIGLAILCIPPTAALFLRVREPTNPMAGWLACLAVFGPVYGALALDVVVSDSWVGAGVSAMVFVVLAVGVVGMIMIYEVVDSVLDSEPVMGEGSAAERWVVIQGDGVTYRHGAQAPLAHIEPFPLDPSPETAEGVARTFLENREGEDRKLLSGWLAVRWLTREGWESPAYLFEWQAPAGEPLTVRATGIDAEDWPLPSLE